MSKKQNEHNSEEKRHTHNEMDEVVKKKQKLAKQAHDTHSRIIDVRRRGAVLMVELGMLLHKQYATKGYVALGYDDWNSYLGSDDIAIDRSTDSKLRGVYATFCLRHKMDPKELDIPLEKLYIAARALSTTDTHSEKDCACYEWVEKARSLSRSDMLIEAGMRKEHEEIRDQNKEEAPIEQREPEYEVPARIAECPQCGSKVELLTVAVCAKNCGYEEIVSEQED